MDELLRDPQDFDRDEPASRSAAPGLAGALAAAAGGLDALGRTLTDWKERAGIFWRDTAAPRVRQLQIFGREHPISPMVFLAVTAAVGIGAVVGTMYDLSYVVSVDGTPVGAVRDTAVFERAVASVETRATRILGYEYTMDSTVTYDRGLTEQDGFATAGQLETYLFNQIGEIMKGYALTVDGVTIGAADDKAALDELLDAIAAPYMTENTVDYGFVEDVRITSDYITSDSNLDLDNMFATLTANTTGETTYTVVKGDTYSEIAYDNDMSLSELMALNPDASVDKLMIGDVLNIKQIIPFLSVYTVDNETYHQAIECPVEYVDDASLYVGNTKVVTQGVEGEALVNADVTYVNGYESERTVLTSQTLSEPTTTVIARGTTPRPKTASTGSYIWPVSGRVTSKFGYRSIFGSYSYHSGIDIAVSYGTPVKAADGGKVTYSGWMSGYGYLVIITHDNGVKTYYGHNSSLVVSVGERVYQGQTIAKAGSTGRSTGVHCHFEVRVNGTAQNPYNYL